MRIIESIRDWGAKGAELKHMSREDVSRLASDIGLNCHELLAAVQRPPGQQDQLQFAFDAFSLVSSDFDRMSSGWKVEIHRNCAMCEQSKRCMKELAKGTFVANSRKFCPNASALRELRNAKREWLGRVEFGPRHNDGTRRKSAKRQDR
ncbi:hypothetical protein [Terrarubrum flagellatum]|uniref:hypothetical protein n=1 Tax=Terrirubrum flagellatum TaxID=2895980 RepID=UPI0031456F6B